MVVSAESEAGESTHLTTTTVDHAGLLRLLENLPGKMEQVPPSDAVDGVAHRPRVKMSNWRSQS